MASFLRLQFAVSEETEDLLIADLWSWGTLGLEQVASAPERRTLLAYFADPPPRELSPLEGEVWRGRGVELMEKMELADRRVIDVGAGTGILALVALVLGARSVVACDVDLTAAFTAGQNSRLNRHWPHLVARSVKTLAPPSRFDLALVNVLPRTILPDIPWLIGLLEPDGEALVSGYLAEESEAYLDKLFELGFRLRALRRDGDWVTFHLELRGS